MIRNWKQHDLYMDFSMLDVGRGQPSDIDMFYIGKNRTLVIGEIKNERGIFKDYQRNMLKNLVESYKKDAIIIYIIHNKRIEDGDEKVNVADCRVEEYYYNKDHRWKVPKYQISVREIIDYFS